MARTMIPDSAGSQFFIMVADAPHLDGQYAAFGKITENAQAAVDISRVNRNMYNDMPKKPQVIKTIRVDTQGVAYPEPEKMYFHFLLRSHTCRVTRIRGALVGRRSHGGVPVSTGVWRQDKRAEAPGLYKTGNL